MAAHMGLGGRGTGERMSRSTVPVVTTASPAKKKVSASAAWREARELVWAHRRRLGMGLALMLISRVAGLVLPGSSKWLIDEVVIKKRSELLLPIAVAGGLALSISAATPSALS